MVKHNFRNFLEISLGSAVGWENQIIIAHGLGYFKKEDHVQ